MAETFLKPTCEASDKSTAEGIERAVRSAHARSLSAEFAQRDLLQKEKLDDDQRGLATLAVCSEVLEHVDQPEVLLCNAADYLASGCRLVVTVPGGPRSAFDRHIGHRRHFTASRLRRLLEESGFEDVTVRQSRIPIFRSLQAGGNYRVASGSLQT